MILTDSVAFRRRPTGNYLTEWVDTVEAGDVFVMMMDRLVASGSPNARWQLIIHLGPTATPQRKRS